MKNGPAARLILAFISSLALTGCNRQPTTESGKLQALGEASDGEPSPYPRARWRLATSQTLNNTVLWVSHILVHHEGSNRRVPGTMLPWRFDGSRPQRSRAEALKLASRVAAEAAAHPERFGDLAREYSNDSTTRARGGSLGGIRASDLRHSPALLDALAALEPGHVSRVIETAEGFEILQRRVAPAEGRVSGAHLVIGHADADWLRIVGHASPARSRAEAVALANSIVSQLRADPSRFSELVDRYSEHPDKVRGGDIGSWSVREPTAMPREIEALAALAVGELSEPLDTPHGISIVQRTPERPRRWLAAQAIKVPFRPGNADSKREAVEQAQRWLAELRAQPNRFDELLASQCCRDPKQWYEGRDEMGLSRAVESLRVGEVAAAPIEQYTALLIARRVEPAALPPQPEPLFELPAPAAVAPEAVMDELPGSVLREELGALAQLSVLGLRDSERAQVEALSEELLKLVDVGSGVAGWSEFWSRVPEQLGQQRSEQYRELVNARLARLLIGDTETGRGK